MKLIDDWKELHRYWSARLSAAAAMFPLVWAGLPDDLKARLPQGAAMAIMAMLAAAAVLARGVAQAGGGNAK